MYTKKIFRENGAEIVESNKNEGSIFGKTERTSGFTTADVYIGVWITPINDKQVDVTVYTANARAPILATGYSESDFHEEFKYYVDSE